MYYIDTCLLITWVCPEILYPPKLAVFLATMIITGWYGLVQGHHLWIHPHPCCLRYVTQQGAPLNLASKALAPAAHQSRRPVPQGLSHQAARLSLHKKLLENWLKTWLVVGTPL